VSKQPETHEKELRAIMYALAESIAQASDEEILAEVREEGDNPEIEAEHIRSRLRDTAKAYQQQKLRAAQQQYDAHIAGMRNKEYALPTTPGARRTLLAAVFARIPELQTALLTAQYRDFSNLTDADIESQLKQLKELGVLDNLPPPGETKP
jgi:hypothetical protein